MNIWSVILQWLLLGYSFACLGLVILSIVLCAISSIRQKVFWMILIILLQFLLTLSYTPGSEGIDWLFDFSFNGIQILDSGTAIITLYIPVGAILFLCFRDGMIRSAMESEQGKPINVIQTLPAPAPLADKGKPAEDESKNT